MKKVIALVLALVCILGIVGCNQKQPPSTNSGKCSRIWDRHHPDDSEINPYFSVTVTQLENALIEHKEDCKIYVNGEVLIGGPGNGCESFYLADITGDGAPELCFGMNAGSGIVDLNITIFDYETRNCIFSLSDRMNHDYILFARNGNLCVMEMEHRTSEVVRTGVLSYDGSQISVSWDSEVNADRDKETTNSGLAVS